MTSIDMTSLSAHHTSKAASKRASNRRWAEWRLKAYGILAIFLAGLALAILISTVVTKAATVVFEYYIDLNLVVEVDEAEKERLRDPNPRIRVSLDAQVREGLTELVGRKLSRTERRELYRLLSTDAGLELGDMLKADPALIGQKLQYPALLDDEVQMFMKGGLGEIVDAGAQGTLAIKELGDTIELQFPAGAFEEGREELRNYRLETARLARNEAGRQENAMAATQHDLDDAEDAAKADIEALLADFTSKRDAAIAKAQQLEAQAADEAADFVLTDSDPSILVAVNGGWLKLTELKHGTARAEVLEAPKSLSPAAPGEWTAEMIERPAASRNLSDLQIAWIETFQRSGRIERVLNTRMLTNSDSSNAELAGIWGAMVGSFWTMIVTFALAFPLGVMAAIYLEEFAPKNRITDLIEVNINNLAAVPSIVFGLFGITVLISGVQLFGIDLFNGLLKNIVDDPRSTPLAGGFVLALMSLPTIIIAARASIRAVPPSIRDAALGVGASRLQTASHHVLPLAMPGILTGSILAMAQALGETAPLIIIGMNSFIQEAPASPFDKGNVLPSLIYLWNNNSERLFDGKTAFAICVLLIFLIAMNALAVLLRKRFERRW
ncbi:phosphate ABC transporter permease PstA [Rhodobacteraceae bacterium NNCM2]|nr:phosphate ABC transporter permease PstA [Coraliihabitans acroporae]